MEVIGWIGNVCLSICGVPQAWQCYKAGNSNGLSVGFILLWATGELLTFSYILSFEKTTWPLIVNYMTNILVLMVMIRYKIWPRKPIDK